MRKTSLTVLIVSFFFQVLFGCSSKDDDLLYSCNPVINRSVAENLPIVWKMNRTVWLKLREDFKRAVYRAFTPAQRKSLWMGKFTELKTLNWTEKEKSHILKAEKFFMEHDKMYSNDKLSDKEANEIDLFFATWLKEAECQLGWDKSIAVSIAGTPNHTVDTKGTIEIIKKGLILDRKKKVISWNSDVDTSEIVDTTYYVGGEIIGDSTGLGASIDCHCSDKVLNDFCFPLTCTSSWIKCNVSEKGCGWGWNQPCDGVCG